MPWEAIKRAGLVASAGNVVTADVDWSTDVAAREGALKTARRTIFKRLKTDSNDATMVAAAATAGIKQALPVGGGPAPRGEDSQLRPPTLVGSTISTVDTAREHSPRGRGCARGGNRGRNVFVVFQRHNRGHTAPQRMPQRLRAHPDPGPESADSNMYPGTSRVHT